MDVDKHNLYELDILQYVEQTSRLSNRVAANKLGVSLKLAHEVLKRMVRKGFLHVTVIHARRWDYFLTPKGIAEKTRLTMEFLDFSMHFYRQARRLSAQLCKDLKAAGQTRVALLGAGDLAEIVYLGVQEWGLTVTAVYDDRERETFLQFPVKPVADLAGDDSDAIIVCLYDPRQPTRARFLPAGLHPAANLHWVFKYA